MKNRLEELRKQRGIKQEDLANALEVSRQTIGSLENGRYNPSVELAYKLAAAPQVVLLSPACSSYDMFENFPARGRYFKNLAAALPK